MSGIPIHTDDPIALATQTSNAPTSSRSSRSAPATSASAGYTPAQPGAAAATPPGTVTSTSNDPPPPQPGSVPIPLPPTTSLKTALPPPPKAGEKAQPPEYYASPPSARRTAVPRVPPPQMLYAPRDPSTGGALPSSTTPTGSNVSFPSSAPSNSFLVSTNISSQASLEHPPGYVQNPYASDMKPEQRLALQQGRNSASESLGYTENRSRAGSTSAKLEEAGEAWEGAKKWVMQKGGEVGDKVEELHGRVWESFGGGK